MRAAIAAQESMHSTLGNAPVELSLKPLLLTEESLPAAREATPRDQALLTELLKYMPKQLADKIRAGGQIEGECRPVIIVFADLSGFTPVAARLGCGRRRRVLE